MILCPANRSGHVREIQWKDGAFDASQVAVYRDNMQSYSTTEPAIDLTSTSFLMWSWRLAQDTPASDTTQTLPTSEDSALA